MSRFPAPVVILLNTSNVPDVIARFCEESIVKAFDIALSSIPVDANVEIVPPSILSPLI